MDISSLLLELYGRVPSAARRAVEGLDLDQLTRPPQPGANTIAWLVWHIGRVQDHHISEFLDTEQLWVTDDWARRFGLDPDPSNTGYGHSTEEVAAVRPERPEVLLDYVAAVDERTRLLLAGVSPDELDQVVDRRWDPPVTLGVRLVSIADDCLQHAGQAAYTRGLIVEA
jgi:uncharacterized damage-inducible protein DinB